MSELASFQPTRVADSRWREITHNLEQCPAAQTGLWAIGFMKGLPAYYRGIHGRGPLAENLSKKREAQNADHEQEPTPDVGRFFNRLSTVINEKVGVLNPREAKKWQGAQGTILEHIGTTPDEATLADLAVVTENGRYVAVAGLNEDPAALEVVEIDGEGTAHRTGRLFDSQAQHPALTEAAFLETAIAPDEHSSTTVIGLSSVANDISPLRHAIWERDGHIMNGLMARGADSIDEIEKVVLISLFRGLELSLEAQAEGSFIKVPNEHVRAAMHEIAGLAEIETDIDETLRTFLCHRYAQEWLERNPQLVVDFVKAHFVEETGLDISTLERWDEYSLIAVGNTYMQRARNVLSQAMLWQFEGHDTLEDSPTQEHWSDQEAYFNGVVRFMEERGVGPIKTDRTGDQDPEAGDLTIAEQQYVALWGMKENLQEIGIEPQGLSDPRSRMWLREFRSSFPAGMGEKLDDVVSEVRRRKKYHPALLKTLKTLGFNVSDSGQSFTEALIGNIMMSKVLTPDRKDIPFAQLAYTPFTYGILREGNAMRMELLETMQHEIEEDEAGEAAEDTMTAEEAIQYVITPTPDDEEPFISMEKRLVEKAPLIMKFLAAGGSDTIEVPDEIREMAASIADHQQLLIKSAERLPLIWSCNPHHINRFHNNGTRLFHASRYLKFVADFVSGVETEFKLKEGLKESLTRRFVGWKPLQHAEEITPDQITGAAQQVLKHGRDRIRFIRGGGARDETRKERGVVIEKAISMLKWPEGNPQQLAELREVMETVLFSELPTMKFVRHRMGWDEWHYFLSTAFSCLCLEREGVIFDVRKIVSP